MLSGEERKKLYAEIEGYRKRIVEARKNLNIADKQKEEETEEVKEEKKEEDKSEEKEEKDKGK